MKQIRITVGEVSVLAELGDTTTAAKIWDALPLSGSVQRWGDEIYFTVPVSMEQESGAKAEIDVGDLAYWPIGDAFCVFFGPTPASIADNPRAYNPVNVFGRIVGDSAVLRAARDDDMIRVEKADA